ncbi:YdcF family protein [Nocardioides okcheonensis]|uniref:YdcF family protein n=1 Tax=Nocardioides okcheonensis TaxID=2894081 RepID=UPI001E43D24C|nr:YdcF family protein [Nocardioides okcheonensis]UFN44435.1 YdcF family protein [Nocardioides okcheonensis]
MGAAAVLAWAEWQHHRWSRTLVAPRPGRTAAVVVLGFRNRGTRANVVNRWRVRAALRSVDPARETTLVLSGGPVGSPVPEARILAAYAAERGWTGPVVLEEESRSTWENITFVVPLVEAHDTIALVSQPAHALKARVYLRRQRPDLAARLAPARDHVPGEWLLAKPALALHGLLSLRRIPRTER